MNRREAALPEGFGIWCRIEDLCDICGYDPHAQFGLLAELAEGYPERPGYDPEEIAEAHPMQALASLIRRYFREYPEAAQTAAAAYEERRTERRGKAA